MRITTGVQWPVVPQGMWGPSDDSGVWSVALQVGSEESREQIYGPNRPYDEVFFDSEPNAYAFAMGLDYGVRFFYHELGLQLNVDQYLVHQELGMDPDEVPTPDQIRHFAEGTEITDGWSDVHYITLDPATNFLRSLNSEDARRILDRINQDLTVVPIAITALPRKPMSFNDLHVLHHLVTYAMASKAALLWNLSPDEALGPETQFDIALIEQFYGYLQALAAGLEPQDPRLLPW